MPLRELIAGELDRPLPAAVRTLATQLAQRAAGGAAAVLFYGSALRDDALDGVLDFYVLLDDLRCWPGSRLAVLANRVLPPNVGYVETRIEDRVLRAKFAVMSLAQFRAAMSPLAWDTTLWARFCQPCAAAYLRAEADRPGLVDALQQAATTASRWAAGLGPPSGDATRYWRALFARTYGAELRVERRSRGSDLVERDASRYAALLPPAWTAAGIGFSARGDGTLSPLLSARERSRLRRRWAWRARLGKPLNLLRLLKAACTFDGAAEYVAWKVERHSGVRLSISDWQRRHPLLAAPGIYLRLRRLGVLR